MSCCAGTPCQLVTAAPWCSGAKTYEQCFRLHTEFKPCIWRGQYCTKGNKSLCPPPTVTLNTGAQMPMLAFGTGMLPVNSVGRGPNRIHDRSALPLVNSSLTLGYTHIDTSEMYPGFDGLGAVLRPYRRRLFITSKVDPTVDPAKQTCRNDGTGCDIAMLHAANETRRRLGTVPDLLLLHRPPPRRGLDTSAQCKRLQASWHGLELAQTRGLAFAIGLSNVCGPLLRCLAKSARIKPAVMQYMLHVGMGPDPLGYRSFGTREWRSVFMAYSVLGGAEQDFSRITASPAVARVAAAHGGHAAGVAISWVAQQRLPMVLISAKPAHQRDNLRVYANPPWGRLTTSEMDALSAEREPAGRLSHWGDCDDALIREPASEL